MSDTPRLRDLGPQASSWLTILSFSSVSIFENPSYLLVRYAVSDSSLKTNHKYDLGVVQVFPQKSIVIEIVGPLGVAVLGGGLMGGRNEPMLRSLYFDYNALPDCKLNKPLLVNK